MTNPVQGTDPDDFGGEVPRGSYYPSAKVNLAVRFEEYGDTNAVPIQTSLPQQRVSSGTAAGGVVPPPPLTVTLSNGVYLIGFGATNPTLGASTLGASTLGAAPNQRVASDPYAVDCLGVIPLTAQLGRNGIRTSDSLSFELNYLDFPVDPRTIRSCGVSFYLGCINSEDYAAGLAGATRSVPNSNGTTGLEPLHIVPDSFVDDGGNRRSNLRFQGFADKIDLEMSDKLAVVKFTCTDNTRLLISQECPPALSIAVSKPIDQAIAEYLAHFPQMAGMTVEIRPQGNPVPVLNKILAKTAFRPSLSIPPAKNGAAATKANTWDYVTQACTACGYTVRIQGTAIIIQQARTLYSQAFSNSRPDDPWIGRSVNGVAMPYRLFVYGRNVSSLGMTRNYGKKEPENVEIVAYSGKLKTTLTARFPEKTNPKTGGNSRQQSLLPGGKSAEQKFKTQVMYGIEDLATLKKIAQQVYEEQGRHNIEVKLKTRDLGSFGGSNLDPDLLDVEAADTMSVQVAQATDDYNSLTSLSNQLSNQASAQAYITGLGHSPKFAAVAAAAQANLGLPTTFRVKKIGFDWDKERGVDLDLDLINFIEVRSDQVLANGEPAVPQSGSIQKKNQVPS